MGATKMPGDSASSTGMIDRTETAEYRAWRLARPLGKARNGSAASAAVWTGLRAQVTF
jgi:hypothetical protein